MSLRMQAQLELEAILETVQSEGFKLVMDDYQLMLDHSYKTAADVCDTSEKWFQRRGEQAQLRNFLAIEENAKAALEGLPEQIFPDEAPPSVHNPLED